MTQTDQQNVPKLRFPGFEGGWETAQISDWLNKVIDYRGKAPPKTETGVPLITARNVKMGHLDFEADEYIDSTLFEAWMNRGRPNPGDVMFTTEAPLGNVAQYPEQGTYALGQRIITLQAGIDRCDSGFLFQTLLGPKMQRKVDARGTGSTAKGIKSRLFVKIPMTAPTLPEQREIAGFLGAVDTKIAQLVEKKRLLEDYKKGCMQQLFSQKIRFKDDTGNDFPDWEEKPFGQVVRRSKGKFDPRKDIETPQLIELENIESETGKIIGVSSLEGQKSLKIRFRQGDVLFSKLRPYLRKYALPDFDGVCTSEIWVLQSRELNGVFLFYLVQSEKFMQLANLSAGSKMPRAEWSVIADSEFGIPHPDEQRKIADFLSALDRKIDLVGQELDHARGFKQGLLQQMFV